MGDSCNQETIVAIAAGVIVSKTKTKQTEIEEMQVSRTFFGGKGSGNVTVDVNVTEKAFGRGSNVSEEVNVTKKAIGSHGDIFNWRFRQRFPLAGR